MEEMTPAQVALMESLSTEQREAIRKVMPLLSFIAKAVIGILDERQRGLLKAVVEEHGF